LLALIPFALMALAVIGLVGFTGVAQRVGVFVAGRSGMSGESYYVTTMIGIAFLLAPAIVARLLAMVGGGWVFPVTMTLSLASWCMEYAAWTVGFGAMALARFQRASSGLAMGTGDAVPSSS
jgi:hypothetical protein